MNQLEERRYYEEDDEIDLMELVHTMVIHKWIIVISTILVAILMTVGGQFYNQKKINLEVKITLNEVDNLEIDKAIKKLSGDKLNLEKIDNESLSYKVATSQANEQLIIEELKKIKYLYEKELLLNNTIPSYSGEKNELELKNYLNSIVEDVESIKNKILLNEIKNKLGLSEMKTLKELKEEELFLIKEISFYKDIVLNYKLQNKKITFGINQNTMTFLSDTLKSEDISYTHYRELLNKYIDLNNRLNIIRFKIKNFNQEKEKINIDDEIKRVKEIVDNLNLEKEEYIKKNLDKLIYISPIKTVFLGKSVYLFLGVGVILGGMLGVFLAFFKEFIKNYKNKYSK